MAMSIVPEMGWNFFYAVPSMQHMFWASFLAIIYHLTLTIPDTCSTLLAHPDSMQAYRDLQSNLAALLPAAQSPAENAVQSMHGIASVDSRAAPALHPIIGVGSIGNSSNSSSICASTGSGSSSNVCSTGLGILFAGDVASEELQALHGLCYKSGAASLVLFGLLLPLALLFTLTEVNRRSTFITSTEALMRRYCCSRGCTLLSNDMNGNCYVSTSDARQRDSSSSNSNMMDSSVVSSTSSSNIEGSFLEYGDTGEVLERSSSVASSSSSYGNRSKEGVLRAIWEQDVLWPGELQRLKQWVSADMCVWVEDVQRLWLVFGVAAVAAMYWFCCMGWSPTGGISGLRLALKGQQITAS